MSASIKGTRRGQVDVGHRSWGASSVSQQCPPDRSTHRGTCRTHSTRLAGGQTHRVPGVEQTSRIDEIRANDPNRTFMANVRLLALPIEEDAGDLRTVLDPLRSVFDLIDGEFYEVNGRRLQSHGHLPGAGKRRARDALEHFTDRSVTTGGWSFSISNRSETRPDLVLNGDELSNVVISDERPPLMTTVSEPVSERLLRPVLCANYHHGVRLAIVR